MTTQRPWPHPAQASMAKRPPQPVSEAIRRWFGGDREPIEGASEQLFERFMRHLPGLAWLKDVSGKFVYINEAMVKALGLPAEHVLGRTNDELVPPALARQYDESDAAALRDDGGVRLVEPYRHTDGSMHNMLVSKFSVASQNGAPALMGGIAIDITDRMIAEERLRRSEERLRLATQTGKVGVWEWELATHRINWTGSLFAIHGIAPGQFDGTFDGFTKLIHPDDRTMVVDALRHAIDGGGSYEVEFTRTPRRSSRTGGRCDWSARRSTSRGASRRRSCCA
jgi:PAS domain S-box-containing protein